jgi:hypothetical protein
MHFSEQWYCGGMLHCSLNIAAWCSHKKQVGPAFVFNAFQTHNLVGPMNRNLCFFNYQTLLRLHFKQNVDATT